MIAWRYVAAATVGALVGWAIDLAVLWRYRRDRRRG
jgi:hypothetical protein